MVAVCDGVFVFDGVMVFVGVCVGVFVLDGVLVDVCVGVCDGVIAVVPV